MIKVQCSKYPEEKCKRREDKNSDLCEFCTHNLYDSKASDMQGKKDWFVKVEDDK